MADTSMKNGPGKAPIVKAGHTATTGFGADPNVTPKQATGVRDLSIK